MFIDVKPILRLTEKSMHAEAQHHCGDRYKESSSSSNNNDDNDNSSMMIFANKTDAASTT